MSNQSRFSRTSTSKNILSQKAIIKSSTFQRPGVKKILTLLGSVCLLNARIKRGCLVISLQSLSRCHLNSPTSTIGYLLRRRSVLVTQNQQHQLSAWFHEWIIELISSIPPSSGGERLFLFSRDIRTGGIIFVPETSPFDNRR